MHKLNEKAVKATGFDNVYDLTMHLLDFVLDENIEEIKKVAPLLTIEEQKGIIFTLFDLPYYISDTEHTTYSDVAKFMQFYDTKYSNKIILKSTSFSKKLKEEVAQWVVVAKTFSKQHVTGIGRVLYVKDESGNNVAFCYKESGKMILLVKGMD